MTRTVNGIEFPDVEPVLLQTTLRMCIDQEACVEAVAIANRLGVGPDEPVNLLDVLRVADVESCLWALCAVLPGQEADRDRVARLMAAEFAAEELPAFEAERPDDRRPRLAIEAARDFALGVVDATACDLAGAAANESSSEAETIGAHEAAWAAWAINYADAAVVAYNTSWEFAGGANWGTHSAIITRYLKA